MSKHQWVELHRAEIEGESSARRAAVNCNVLCLQAIRRPLTVAQTNAGWIFFF